MGPITMASESNLYLHILFLYDPCATPWETRKYFLNGERTDCRQLETKPGWSATQCATAGPIRPIGRRELLHTRIHINQWKWCAAKCEIILLPPNAYEYLVREIYIQCFTDLHQELR